MKALRTAGSSPHRKYGWLGIEAATYYNPLKTCKHDSYTTHTQAQFMW